MKKVFLLPVLLILNCIVYAQDYTYGINGGVNIYDLETSEESGFYPLSDVDLGIHFGAFFDYSINNKIGVKTDVIINSSRDRYFNENDNFNPTFYLKVNTLQIAPKLKFYPKNNYNQGFYFLIGPRMTLITSIKNDEGEKVEDFYKSSNFGAQGGFGINIIDFFAVELFADITFTDPLEIDLKSQKLFAAFINLNFNLEHLINK